MLIASYTYKSPEGTGEELHFTEVICKENIADVIEFFMDNFDGIETFMALFLPAIMVWYNSEETDYIGDDSPAGQWLQITKNQKLITHHGQ